MLSCKSTDNDLCGETDIPDRQITINYIIKVECMLNAMTRVPLSNRPARVECWKKECGSSAKTGVVIYADDSTDGSGYYRLTESFTLKNSADKYFCYVTVDSGTIPGYSIDHSGGYNYDEINYGIISEAAENTITRQFTVLCSL